MTVPGRQAGGLRAADRQATEAKGTVPGKTPDGTRSETRRPAGRAADPATTAAARDRVVLGTIAVGLIILATSWYLLDTLAGVIRPLFLAVFLAYVLLPWHHFLRRWLPRLASVAVLAVAGGGLLLLLAVLLRAGALQLSEDLPHLTERARGFGEQIQNVWAQRAPSWLRSQSVEAAAARTDWSAQVRTLLQILIGGAAGALTEAFVVGFYLLFVLLEAGRFPDRLRRAFPEARAEEILAVLGRINAATATYLHVKVKASLLLAAVATLILSAFGVKLALMWGLLTFVANFIPYIGSVVACSLPILFTFLQLDLDWRPVAVGGLLLGDHLLTAYVVEPAMTGKAVGLSPLVILIAVAFWGQCWGLVGMVLAVPLTVVLKIVLESLPPTRPLAQLMGED